MLRVQVRRWAPFPEVKYVAQWSGHRASVYAWNDNEVKQAIAAAGLNERRCTVYPESFIRAPAQNGVRLIAVVEGFEAQVWQDGFLAFSRWWPQKPGKTEWQMFLRSAGTPHDGPVPEPISAEILPAPWLRPEGYLGTGLWMLEDPRYVVALIALIAAPFVYLSVEYATLAIADARVKNALSTLSIETQGVRKQRSVALANLDQIEDYLALEVYPSQFEIVTSALGVMQNIGVKITEWTYDVGTLSITLRSENSLDATVLISAFEKSGVFKNVSASRVGQDNQLRLRMDVLPRPMRTARR